MRPGAPIRPAFAEARAHLRQIAGFGFVVGFLLGIATTVAPRWGSPWFSIFLGAVIGLMMVAYIAVPARIIGAKPTYSRRERMVTTVVSGALGVTVSLPPYLIGRLGFLMLGSKVLLIPGIILVAIGVTLEAGATGAVRAIKLSAGLQQRSRPAPAEPDARLIGSVRRVFWCGVRLDVSARSIASSRASICLKCAVVAGSSSRLRRLSRLLDQRRGHRGRDHGDEPDALEHQDRADEPAFGVGGHDVAVTHGGHGLERPPHALSQGRELVVVDEPDQDSPGERSPGASRSR